MNHVKSLIFISSINVIYFYMNHVKSYLYNKLIYCIFYFCFLQFNKFAIFFIFVFDKLTNSRPLFNLLYLTYCFKQIFI